MIKKIVLAFVWGSTLLSALMSCNHENGEEEDVYFAVNQIHTGIYTKAVDNIWQNGDVVGVTMYTPDTLSILHDQFNYPYINRADGANGVFNPLQGTLFFPQNGDSMRLKAYYPYAAGLGTDQLLVINVTDQDSLPAIDLMTGFHLAGYDKTDPDVRMRFYHRMCKLVFELTTEDESDELDLASCELTIEGMEEQDTYDLYNDTFLNEYTGIIPLAVPLRTGQQDSIRTAIVLPREAGAGVVFEFMTPAGDTYIARMSEQLPLTGGNRYTFRITLSKNPLIVTADIEPWISNPEEEYEAK